MYKCKYIVVHCKEETCLEMDNVNIYTDITPNGDEGDFVVTAKIMRDIGNMSDGRQLLFGVAAGFISGYSLLKLGKWMCIAIGTGVVMLQLATQNDYVKFNLVRALGGQEEEVNHYMAERQRRASVDVRPMQTNFRRWLATVRSFLLAEPNLTTGCLGGFFIGLGMA